MSATCVVQWSDRRVSGAVRAELADAASKPPPLPSMRVPKGAIAHNDTAEEDDWAGLMARAKATLAEEEREWQAALARAKRVLAPVKPASPADDAAEWRRLRDEAAARQRRLEEREWLMLARRARAQSLQPAPAPRRASAPVRSPQAPALRVVAWP